MSNQHGGQHGIGLLRWLALDSMQGMCLEALSVHTGTPSLMDSSGSGPPPKLIQLIQQKQHWPLEPAVDLSSCSNPSSLCYCTMGGDAASPTHILGNHPLPIGMRKLD